MPQSAGPAVLDTLYSGHLAMGTNVGLFEKQLAQWLGTKNVCAVGDASGGLTLALWAAGVRAGDEVIMSPLTCLATSMPVANLFARPVWCDVDPATGMMDSALIPSLITSRTRAILAYHWSGNVGDLDNLRRIATQAEIALIEDATEAFGAEFGGRKLGNQSADFTVLSFGAVRHLTCGEGGAICALSDEADQLLRRTRRYGIDNSTFRLPNGDLNPASDIPNPGYNFPMNNLSAAIGLQQFSGIDEILETHRKNGEEYARGLRGVHGIRILNQYPGTRSGYWTYSFRAERRNALIQKLVDHGIAAQRLHVRNDAYTCFLSEPPRHPLVGVDIFDRENVSIPCGWWVDDESRQRIIDCISAGW